MNPPEAAEAPKRRIGRPRASGVEPTGDVREQILDAAAYTFVAKGYTATSTREIAAAVGLRQGSLAHYFERKQDILVELVRRSLRPALDHMAVLEDTAVPAAAKFYRFVHSDCLSLCEDELNSASLLVQPEIRNLDIAEIDIERTRLTDVYTALIAQACDEGSFLAEDSEFAARATIGMVESVASWFERDSDAAPRRCADWVARAITAGLLAPGHTVDDVVASAEAAPPAPPV